MKRPTGNVATKPSPAGVARAAATALKDAQLSLAVAESCTGGLLSALITSVPGSSAYFNGSVVAYNNRVKEKLLGVRAATLERYGAVSAPTATEMAEGARKRLSSGVAVSITGIAGPGGGNARKPVGTVYIAVSTERGTKASRFNFPGSRAGVRKAAALAALDELLKAIEHR